MPIVRNRRNATLLLTGLLAPPVAVGCSKEADRAPALESGSSPAVPVDSATRRPDTSIGAVPAETASSPTRPAAHPRPVTSQRAAVAPAPKPTSPTPRADTQATKPVADPATAPAPTATSAPEAAEDQWLKYDAATNTVTFELIAGPFTFNGYRNGEATLVVPSKANVVMNFVNKDGTPHSAIIISGDGPVPNSATDPAIPRAYTNKVLEGLPQEASDVMRFQVRESGTYRIFCGVPGHGLSGMWIWMKVDAAAKAPSFGPTKT
jgi:hypothetical protein